MPATAAAAAEELAGGGPSSPADECVVVLIMTAEARSCPTAVPLPLKLLTAERGRDSLLSSVPNLGW